MTSRKSLPLGTPLERVRLMTVSARDRLAERLLAVDVVYAAMSAAAGEGFDQVAVMMPKPVDLSGTPSARQLVERLHADGFSVSWGRRSVLSGGRELFAVDLVIGWQG